MLVAHMPLCLVIVQHAERVVTTTLALDKMRIPKMLIVLGPIISALVKVPATTTKVIKM